MRFPTFSMRYALVLPVAAVLAACGGRGSDAKPSDDALSRDLALATAAQPTQPQQFVSPQELGVAGQQGYATGAPQGYQPVYQPAPRQVVYRTAPRSTGRASAPAPVYRAPQPVRHTKRDAMIGATAGAVAGAAIGRDIKGAVIGAAAGGLLGAVVGHTIDKTP